ncbi:MAG TPA: nucleoside transporter C-terminal domain-containing protein, partial [Myxococcota bacterium]|nr:nucleoside transporter C-terminal domain-containing protein [Myxococcota bacterium]
MSEIGLRGVSAIGFCTLLGLAWLCSSDRRAVDWRLVGWGVAMQLGLAFALLAKPVRALLFPLLESLVERLVEYTGAGTRFVFGPLLDTGYVFALHVLPIIVFMGSLFGLLYHLGLIQPLVHGLARILARTLRISGAEALAAVANVFVGMIESGVVVRPYLASMTRSELFSFMTLGMATIAGSVLVAYAGMLGGEYAGHLVVASLVSAPAGLVVAKLMIPETGRPQTLGRDVRPVAAPEAVNWIDAAAEGGLVGLRLALNIGALLVAFVALVALANGLLSGLGGLFGYPELTLQAILGVALAPLAWLLGVPWSEAREIGALIGLKTVVNEFVAYQALADAIAAGSISPRGARIAAYALCGFANLGSLAILIGGIQGIAPERRPEAAALGLRSILAG